MVPVLVEWFLIVEAEEDMGEVIALELLDLFFAGCGLEVVGHEMFLLVE